jgi:hypothetical protein
MLVAAAILIFVLGSIHSILGEHYIVRPLCKRENLPKLFGGDSFTKGTIRFAWHLTTIAWWSIAFILISFTWGISQSSILKALSILFFLSGVLPLYFTRGKHISWIVLWIVASLTLAAC